MYWYAMVRNSRERFKFPGGDNNPNGIPAGLETQAPWIDTVKIRVGPPALGQRGLPLAAPGAWDVCEFRRNVGTPPGRPARPWPIWRSRLVVLAPIAAIACCGPGLTALPPANCRFDKPERFKGIERNVVISSWEWGTPKMYLQKKRPISVIPPSTPTARSTAPPEESWDFVPVLDPVHNTTKLIKHPYRDPAREAARRSKISCSGATSRYGTTHQHWQRSDDRKGRRALGSKRIGPPQKLFLLQGRV